ncbi:hypothetical protein NM208_g15569 [Fusarium decemcellulare]|uniref:Uncharacterized protein n=1 Tax=Fusarium decemcellulare TaxID=57161 RepID=A0ACC1RE50_9HYPO|nr:hypothetical protein NM208_g15569 [Fusarium decemcellulare]
MGAWDHRLLHHNFYDAAQTRGQRRPARPAACCMELATIVETCSVARLWTSQNVNEALWNALVHCPLLKLALYPPVEEPSTSDANLVSTRPRTDCVPRNVYGDMLESKLVDSWLAISDNEMLDAALRTVQAASPRGSGYISVSIETKMQSGSSETALTQLSAWAACHLERLRALRRFKAEMQGQVLEHEGRISIALPLLAAVGTTWKLFFAADLENEIAIVHTITLGDIEQLVGCYQVGAALRELAHWPETTFRAWLIEM